MVVEIGCRGVRQRYFRAQALCHARKNKARFRGLFVFRFPGEGEGVEGVESEAGTAPDVRRFRVLAEDAIKHQEFEKAFSIMNRFGIEPLWPQGQYNAALLYVR